MKLTVFIVLVFVGALVIYDDYVYNGYRIKQKITKCKCDKAMGERYEVYTYILHKNKTIYRHFQNYVLPAHLDSIKLQAIQQAKRSL